VRGLRVREGRVGDGGQLAFNVIHPSLQAGPGNLDMNPVPWGVHESYQQMLSANQGEVLLHWGSKGVLSIGRLPQGQGSLPPKL
jgi:hypothetical protein